MQFFTYSISQLAVRSVKKTVSLILCVYVLYLFIGGFIYFGLFTDWFSLTALFLAYAVASRRVCLGTTRCT